MQVEEVSMLTQVEIVHDLDLSQDSIAEELVPKIEAVAVTPPDLKSSNSSVFSSPGTDSSGSVSSLQSPHQLDADDSEDPRTPTTCRAQPRPATISPVRPKPQAVSFPKLLDDYCSTRGIKARFSTVSSKEEPLISCEYTVTIDGSQISGCAQGATKKTARSEAAIRLLMKLLPQCESPDVLPHVIHDIIYGRDMQQEVMFAVDDSENESTPSSRFLLKNFKMGEPMNVLNEMCQLKGWTYPTINIDHTEKGVHVRMELDTSSGIFYGEATAQTRKDARGYAAQALICRLFPTELNGTFSVEKVHELLEDLRKEKRKELAKRVETRSHLPPRPPRHQNAYQRPYFSTQHHHDPSPSYSPPSSTMAPLSHGHNHERARPPLASSFPTMTHHPQPVYPVGWHAQQFYPVFAASPLPHQQFASAAVPPPISAVFQLPWATTQAPPTPSTATYAPPQLTRSRSPPLATYDRNRGRGGMGWGRSSFIGGGSRETPLMRSATTVTTPTNGNCSNGRGAFYKGPPLPMKNFQNSPFAPWRPDAVVPQQQSQQQQQQQQAQQLADPTATTTSNQ